MNTGQLINVLAADAAPPRSFSHLFGYATAFGIASAALPFFILIGPRPDLAAALHSWRFLFKFIITAPLAGLAIVTIFRMARPATWRRHGLWLVLAPAGLLVAAALLELVLQPKSLWMVRLIGSNSENCMTIIPLLAIGPLACFLAVLRNGAPYDPGIAGASAGVAAAAIAATIYALNCFDDSPLFVVTWYPLATSVVVAAGYACGSKLLVW